jgi:Transposase DDE domain group 1
MAGLECGILALRESRTAASLIGSPPSWLSSRVHQIAHSLADIVRFRHLMISAGYEDGNDANSLRGDPMCKMALGLSPSNRELGSQSTISRSENLPDVHGRHG